MNEIVKKLLIEYGYVESSSEFDYFSKDDSAFYFLLNLSESELAQITKKELLDKNESYSALIDDFNKVLDKGEEISIEKNSSLIVLVECSTLESIASLQQQILLLEEDEYFFKKYVLMYTTEAISKLASEIQGELSPFLRDKLYNSQHFGQFANEGFVTASPDYLIILQLFIKLPFLNLDFENQDFKSLAEKLTEALGHDLILYQTLLEKTDNIKDIDFSNPESEDAITQLLSILPHD